MATGNTIDFLDSSSLFDEESSGNNNFSIDELQKRGIVRDRSLDKNYNKNVTNAFLNDTKASNKSGFKGTFADGILRYPYEALTRHTDYLQISIVNYESVSDKTGGNLVSQGARGKLGSSGSGSGRVRPRGLATRALQNTGTILLPIPNAVQDGNTVSVATSKLNGIEAAGAAAVYEAMGGNNQTAPTSASDLVGGIGANITSAADKFVSDLKQGTGSMDVVKRLALQRMTSSAVNLMGGNITASQLMARQAGEIFNPNIEVLFDGPGLRNFKFSYKMMPRNPKEAQQIQLIIRTFKQNMSPKVTASLDKDGGNFFLKSPNIFELKYMSGSNPHKYLHRFKQCFLTDFSVNYTGENTHMTYNDGSPVSYIMDLSFKELEPVYHEDYDEGEGELGVGF